MWVISVLILLLAGDVHVNPGPIKSRCKSLSMCHANVRSLSRSKLLAVKTSLANLYDIITLSETHLHQGIGDDLFEIEGFHDIIRNDRNEHGGGVAIYVKSNIVFKRHFEFESPSIEAIWISVQTLQGKIMICCCYRPPNKTDFWDEFDTVIDQVKQSDNYRYMFVLGDLNADPKTNNGNKLIQLCLEHNLQYLINEPTRITATSQTILDQVLTNAPNFISSMSVSPPLSTNDHCTISACADFKVHDKVPYYRHIWLFKKADFNQFRQALRHADFMSVFELIDLDDVCRAWSDKFLEIAKEHVPNKKIL